MEKVVSENEGESVRSLLGYFHQFIQLFRLPARSNNGNYTNHRLRI